MQWTILKKYILFAILLLLGNCSPSRTYVDGVYTGKIKSISPFGWSPELTIVIKKQRLIAVSFDYLADERVYPNSQEMKKQVRDLGKVNPELIYYSLIKQLLDKQEVRLKTPSGAVRVAGHFKRLAEVLLDKAERGQMEPVILEEQVRQVGIKPVSDAAALKQNSFQPMAVVSSHHLATQAGMEVLEAGGTAADAAFTVAAVLTVVEPWYSSILGGGTWALYYEQATRRVYALDAVGPAGSKVKAELFAKASYGGAPGMHQAVVPGAWGGWMAWLKRFGTWSLTDLFKQALVHAERGVAASAECVQWLKQEEAVIRRWPDTAAIYLPYGRVPRVGELIYQKQMARTFQDLLRIYETARIFGEKEAFDTVNDYFYRGPLAEKIIRFMERKGGLLTLDDFRNFYAGLVEPLVIDYKGIQVYQNPPNSQGIAMLIGLNILKGFDFSSWEVDSPDLIHVLAEAGKLAHADKYRYVGDPKFVDVPVTALLSEQHATAQRARISRDKVLTWPIPDILPREKDQVKASHTTTFSITDRYGNAAAVTTSLGANFLVVGDTGIVINNRMRMMDFKENLPNTIFPGKKVSHTSNPYMALLGGKPYILGGNTGVDTQPQGQVQQFIYVVEFGLTPQEAVARPRFVAQAFPVGFWPHRVSNALVLETDFPPSVRNALYKRGHTILNGYALGIANMLVIDPETGEVLTGADPRCSTSLGLVR